MHSTAASAPPGAPNRTDVTRVDAVVVGAGFAGLYALHRLRDMGMAVRVIEAGSGVGGTWYWNRYPGARCDVESVDYSYSFSDELQQEWTWSERYASQPEILRYVEHVAERFDLYRDIVFDTRVESAAFDEDEQRWTVVTDAGATLSARVCVMATGCLSTTRVPEIPGLERFEGEWLHPGAWPRDQAVDLRGKRVGVIGTGSTGIQIVSAVAPEVEELVVFQRTANYSMPAHNGPLDADTVAAVKATYPERRRESRRTRRGFPVPPQATTESVFSYSPRERRERLERMWAHGGVGVDRRANEVAAEFVREQIRGTVRDPGTAELLSPRDHPLGGKRPCVDTDYYETFNRDNVRLVDLRAEPIAEFVPTGLRTTAETFALDTVVFATGYDAITGTLAAIDIRGRDGRRLKDKWSHGAIAYLGLLSAGFPNLFTITGPGSPSVLCNMIVSIEQHVELMVALLERAARDERPVVDADPAAEARWARHVAEIADGTLLVEADSWYLGANIPGKPRMFMPYAGGMGAFDAECALILERGFEGFRFGAAAPPAAVPDA
jgi:cyclohexanone monooxygenase